MYYPVCNDTELISNNVQFAKREKFKLKLNIAYRICYSPVCSVFRKMTPLRNNYIWEKMLQSSMFPKFY